MNDETKEILIDLIGYHSVKGTGDDPGFGSLADIVNRATKALEHHAEVQKHSSDIDPFAMDVVGSSKTLKHEADLY
jgi:hypothetical protein